MIDEFSSLSVVNESISVILEMLYLKWPMHQGNDTNHLLRMTTLVSPTLRRQHHCCRFQVKNFLTCVVVSFFCVCIVRNILLIIFYKSSASVYESFRIYRNIIVSHIIWSI